ncbi:DUF3127 domain-containing protein [Arsenicibacter rosenii]|uniref:DUF3127 domain-containing protein n=1 Tax=Arsenicibacter rosenii TaxID=1750698 RepID=A0A1S2VAB9_9BACT|nr:DUF3127 domain-containing protein [Arsenicibacter rosenii]OIN55632.1 hypothetical protein BLX24_29040 [Arsenicibacter rosenii]
MAQSLQITGKYLGAGQIQTVGQNNTMIRKFWIDVTDNPAYPNTPEFQLRGDKVYLPDNINRGQTITVSFNLDGRKYENQQTGKKGVFNSINAYKIDIVQIQSAAVPQHAQPSAPVSNPFAFANDQSDDLPF